MNWLSQIFSVTWYGLRTIPQRLGATLVAVLGIAGVVGVLVGVLSMAQGFRATLTTGDRDDIALVLRESATSEMSSGLGREQVRTISDSPGVARNEAGPLTSAELFVIINIPKRSSGTDANVPFRGVEAAAPVVRGKFEVIEGRMFERGKNELVAGVGAAREFAGLEVGNTIKLGKTEWNVVGLFKTDGGMAETELWTDATVMQQAYQRGDSFQSLWVQLASPGSFQEFKDAVTRNPQLSAKVVRQKEFFAEQSEGTTGFITTIGVVIAFFMSIGALFGALNTMYNAVASRGREIATLRALGFGRTPVLISVLMESFVLALAGGIIGSAIAYLAFDGYGAATMNFQTFSQVAFAFRVTPELLLIATVLCAGLGLLGGIFPAIRAARLPIAAGLREG
jgi:putative ABC transport system permease protein